MIGLTKKEYLYLKRLESLSRCLGYKFNMFNLDDEEMDIMNSLINKKYISGKKYTRKEISLMEYRRYRENGFKEVFFLAKKKNKGNSSRKVFDSKQKSDSKE